jgi:ketosteroid isomerase-like protein
MLRTITTAALLAALLPGAQAAPDADADAELARAHATIDAANNDWLPAMRRRDPAAIAAFYAEPEGVLVLDDGRALQGRAAISALYARNLAGAERILKADFVQDSLRRYDDLIYEAGHIEMDRRGSDGKPTHSKGKYFTVWRLKDGRWEILRNLVL